MSAGVRVAIRLAVTPILVAALFGLLWLDHQRLRTDPHNMLVLPILITVVCAAALLEIYRMARIKGHKPAWIEGTLYLVLKLVSVAVLIAYPVEKAPGWAKGVYSFADYIFLLYLLARLVFYRAGFAPEDAALTYLAAGYVLLMKLAIDLYNLVPVQAPRVGGDISDLDKLAEEIRAFGVQTRADNFMYLLLFIFVASKVPDMLGYVVGKTMGKHPMAPVLSPSKTWEGGIAGFCGGMIASAAILFMTPLRQVLGRHDLLLIVLAGLVTISAMVGDLVKSAFKRWAGVKDSGLIPEFGGVLDIIDSFLLSVPTTYLFLSLVPRQF
jgi:phosphatidate cytidylyltransferase